MREYNSLLAPRATEGPHPMTHAAPTFSLGLIGCGHWGPNHLRAFMSLPGVRVVWAADPDPARREHVARMYGHVRIAIDHRPILDDPSVDAVIIATSATSHFDLCTAAIQAGKHVLCEKPLCLRSTECLELVTAAKRRGVVLMVGHVFLFNGGILKLHELILQKALGRLYYASAIRTNLGPVRQDVNAAYDLASHEVSIFNFLFDSSPQTVSAVGRACLNTGIEDVVFITLRYPNDILISVTASWLNPKKVREITLVGEKKMVTWNDLAVGPVAIYDKGVFLEPYYENFGEFQLAVRDGDVTIPRVSAEEPLRRQASFFIESLAKGSAGMCSGEAAWHVIRSLEAINESLAKGGSPVTLGPGRTP